MIIRALSVLLAVLAGHPGAAAQEKIKVGYWTSGFSVGFGAVLEAGKFLEQQGLTPEFIRFSDVNGPTKALITHSIDVAFAAPATGAFTLGAQGAPIEIVLATQVAEATFVAKDGSPLRNLADLKGKKVGMSPAGSATYAIAAAVLERNYGLKPSDYTAVPGNEGQLVQFLQRGDIEAASLRAVTIASVPDLKLQVLGRVVDEWKRMTKTNAVPILAAAIVHKNFSQQHPASRGEIRARHDGSDPVRPQRNRQGLGHAAQRRQSRRQGRHLLCASVERDLHRQHGARRRRNLQGDGGHLSRGQDAGRQRARQPVRHRSL